MQATVPAPVHTAPSTLGAGGRDGGRPYRIRGKRIFIFLRDAAVLALTCVGGPQAHLAMFERQLVRARRYLPLEELLELNALCQMLPGPSSTQTLTAVAFRLGGPYLAFMTLLVWVTPSVLVMGALGCYVAVVGHEQARFEMTHYLAPVAVGLVAQAGFSFAQRTIFGNLDAGLMAGAALITYYFPSPYLTPGLLFIGGVVAALRFRRRQLWQEKQPMRIQWANFFLWIGVFAGAAVAGELTHWLPIRLFENFYRNGSLIFGGGQVLVPLMLSEFVEFKHYLTQQEFLLGYGAVQALPGPVFSFCTYLGVLAGRPLGLSGQLAGGLAATLGIFLPGTFLIFFIIRFWDQLKRYRVVKASLEGINAVSAGLIAAAALLMYRTLPATDANLLIIAGTFLLLQFTRIPSWAPVVIALVVGWAVG